ncbi:unnamed protein product [Orchesella dallaii]|uniref:Uncharacterized protein n=1 Tax=Orchesella dallaii TaxID=48710 RepID=A0ABP1QZM8_9HEXA
MEIGSDESNHGIGEHEIFNTVLMKLCTYLLYNFNLNMMPFSIVRSRRNSLDGIMQTLINGAKDFFENLVKKAAQ